MNLFRRLIALFRKEKLDREMAEEMRFHLEQRAAEHVSEGMSSDDARYAALRKFGGVEQTKEIARGQRPFRWLEETSRDMCYAARALRKSPGFTLTAGFTLALGIGLVALQFSFISGALFHGLPFEKSERLMRISATRQRGAYTPRPMLEEFYRLRGQQKSFSTIAAHAMELIEISGSDLPARRYEGAAFSAGLIELLGIRPVLGRGFLPSDENPDAAPVVLLSYRAWQEDFGGDPGVVGRAIRMRGEPATIIGVMPEGFGFPKREVAWVNLRPVTPGRGPHEVRAVPRMIGRLRDDTTLTSARAEFDVLVGQTSSAPAAGGAPPRAEIEPLGWGGGSSSLVVLLYSLLGMVGGVLAIACLNVANLLSARALQRGPELAVRSSLGASRGRLIRQMLSESTLLALIGAGGGLLLAYWGTAALNVALAADPKKPLWLVIELDYRVFAATAGLTLLVGVVTGLIPALRATRANASEMLKETQTTGARLGRANRGLVVVQVALSCAILLATSVLVQTARRAAKPELPFDPATMLSATFGLSTVEFEQASTRRDFCATLLERVAALPGVSGATLTGGYPAINGAGISFIEVPGMSYDSDFSRPMVYANHGSPGFLHELGIPLRAGRDFTGADRSGSELVAIVNESFARLFWPGESALGKTFQTHIPQSKKENPWITVVGVVMDLPTDRAQEARGARYHLPVAQAEPRGAMLLLRSQQDPRSLERPVRDIVRALSPDVPVFGVKLLSEQIADRTQTLRSLGGLGLAFGLSGLLLAIVGVYSLTMFAVQRRTREFGIRVALGGTSADLLHLVIKQGAKQLAVGLTAGAALGWAGSQHLLHALVNSTAPSPYLYAAVLVVIAVVVLCALWLPARRAAKVDPMVALRAE